MCMFSADKSRSSNAFYIKGQEDTRLWWYSINSSNFLGFVSAGGQEKRYKQDVLISEHKSLKTTVALLN